MQYGSSSGDASVHTVTLSGPITITEGRLGIGCWAPFDLKGTLNVPEVFVGFQGYGQNKNVQLWSGANKIGVISLCSAQVLAKADNAFGNAQMHLFQIWPSAESYSCFNLNGKKMRVSSFSYREDIDDQFLPKNNSDKGGLFLTYSPTVVTITGTNGTCTCIQKLNGRMDLIVDARDYSDTFEQRFIDRVHQMTGTLAVSNGVMRICTSSTFANVPAVTVGPNGKLVLDQTSGTVFPGCERMIIDGKLEVTEGSANPFTDGMLELVLGANAELTLPDSMQLSVARLEIDGEVKTTGAFSSGNVPQIKGGVLLLPVSGERVWTGGASANESISEPANWGGALPDILYGSTSVFFGESGTNVDVDCVAQFDAVRVKAPERGKGFAFTPVSEEAAFGVRGNVTFEKAADNESVTNVYAFGLPVRINGSSEWIVLLNDAVRMSEGLFGSVVSSGFIKSGLGCLELGGESSVAGAVRLSGGYVSISGTLGPSGDGSRGNAMIFESGAKSLAFDATVVKKDFYIENSEYSNLTFTGPTNVLEGFVSSSRGRNFMIDADSVLVLEGGASVGGKWNLMGGTVVFRDKPWIGTEWLCSGYDMSATRTSFEVQGSCPRMWVRAGSSIDFCVSDANTNSLAYFNLDGPNNNGGGTFNLNSTTQNVDRVYGSMGVITGNYPACIAINQSAQHMDSVSADVQGGVGFFMRGDGSFTLSGRDFTSCGDIAVDNGVIEIASDATWRNGTNVFVSGSGTLKLGASNRFNGSFVQFHLGADADEWMIDIPSGCSQTVDYAWDADGNRLPCGVYGATGVTGVSQTRYAAHFAAGGGVIKVKMHGTVVSFR